MTRTVLQDDAFGTGELSLRASDTERFPAVKTPLSKRFTEVEFIADRTALIDVEEATLPTLTDGTWGTTLTTSAVSRARKQFSLLAPKVGKTFEVAPNEIQSVRKTGEVSVESLQSVQDRKIGQVALSIEDYHERARLQGVLGKVINNAGTVVYDLRDSAYFDTTPNAVVGMGLDAADPASGELRQRFAKIKRAVDDRLKIGQNAAAGYEVQCNSEFFDMLRWHPETMEAFARWEDLAQPTGDITKPFTFAGFAFYDYNRAGIESGKAVVMPVVQGMYKTIFTPGDFMGVLNEDALSRYLSVEGKDHDKGFEYEMSTNALHICTRPEAIFELDAGAGDIDDIAEDNQTDGLED